MTTQLTTPPTPLADAVETIAATQKQFPDYEPLWKRFRGDLRSAIIGAATDERRLIREAYHTFNRTLRGVRHIDIATLTGVKAASEGYLALQTANLCCEPASEVAFDKWHEETCAGLSDVWRDCFPLYAGQAQKWVNITLKYHAAFGDSGAQPAIRAVYLPFLHVPLDTYVYNFLSRVDREIPPSDNKTRCQQIRQTRWSRLENYAIDYLPLQQLFREIAAPHGFAPIALDLIVWQGA